MTKRTNAELIAEAREAAKRADWYMTGESPLLRALADALEAAEQERDEARKAAEDHVLEADAVHVRLSAELREVNQERDQLSAVVEKAEDFVTRHYLDTRFGDEVLPILATAPADVLRELKAEAWDEGSETGFTHGMSYQAGTNSAMYYQNPYRAREEQG